jgi:hypothetical protein
MIKVLQSLADDRWTRIDQAIETSKIAYGPNATVYAVMRLAEDAIRPTPDGWSSSALLYLIGDPESTDEELLRSGTDNLREKIDDLRSRHELWLSHLIRLWGSELNWQRVHGDYLRRRGDVLLRLAIQRRDESILILEMPPGSTVRLATAILATLMDELPSEAIEVDEEDMGDITRAVDNLRTVVTGRGETHAQEVQERGEQIEPGAGGVE